MARILIIDDSPIALKVARAFLEAAGHTVDTQPTPAGLPAIVNREKPDVILIDVSMPQHNGDQILRALRTRGSTSNFIALLFSAKPDAELTELVRSCGADGYVSKNAGGDALVDAVNAHLARRGLR